MSEVPARRLHLMSTWTLLVVNVVLLGANVASLAHWTPNWLLGDGAFAEQASKNAAHLGMSVAYTRNPLALYVAKEFPETNAFQLFDESQQLLIASNEVDGEEHEIATRKAEIVLGLDMSLFCYYSLDRGIRVHELKLYTRDWGFTDLDADGQYDVRISFVTKPSLQPLQIWYEGGWRDTMPDDADSSKYRRRLRDGGAVEFDLQSGRWIPLIDNPDIDEG